MSTPVPQRHRKPRSGTDHVVMRGNAFICDHCGEIYEPNLPAPIEVIAASCKAFTKTHARCKAPARVVCDFCRSSDHDWHGHVSATVKRPQDWPICGDTGISSMAIWRHMMGLPQDPGRFWRSSNPLDPSDFGRCHRLLTAPWATTWRTRIGEMARYLDWGGLVRRWTELENLYLEEIQNQSGKAPRLYAMMREILDGGGPQ